MLQVIAIDDVKPDEPRRYYPAHVVPDLGLTALTKAEHLDGPLHLRPWRNAKGSWVAIVDRPPVVDLEAIGAKLRDALGYWTARGSKSIIDGSKADDPIGDAMTPWGHVARVALGLDRPAPTPTAAPGVDLDAVAQDFRDAMEGPPGNRAAIKFYWETWPALIAELRAARAEIAALRAMVDEERAAAKRSAEIATGLGRVFRDLRASVAEAKRLGLEAARLAASMADDAREYGNTPDRANEIAAALEAL